MNLTVCDNTEAIITKEIEVPIDKWGKKKYTLYSMG